MAWTRSMVSLRTDSTTWLAVTPAPLTRTASSCATTVSHCCSATGRANSSSATSDTIELTASLLCVSSTTCRPSSTKGSAS
jgi:hypothetical protein